MLSTLTPPLSTAAWTSRAAAHAERVTEWTDAFVQRRSRNEKHPVHDFLFTYYNFSPAKLKQWMPAIGEVLEVVAVGNDDVFVPAFGHDLGLNLLRVADRTGLRLDLPREGQAATGSAHRVIPLAQTIRPND